MMMIIMIIEDKLPNLVLDCIPNGKQKSCRTKTEIGHQTINYMSMDFILETDDGDDEYDGIRFLWPLCCLENRYTQL